MSHTFRYLFLVILILGTARTPSVAKDKKSAIVKALPEKKGTVITVEGIGGIDKLSLSVSLALQSAKKNYDVQRFHWTHGSGRYFRDLQDTQHLLKKSNELAEMIRELHEKNPEKPIYLIAHSGGACLVIFALEALPPNTVERAVFLSAAVSPTYDLRKAMKAVRREIISFHSNHDQLVLNWGTRQFGTADRYYGPSAGLRGFTVPTSLDDDGKDLYQRLIQVPWRGRMLLEGNTGGHHGTIFPTFISAEVLPWFED